MNIDWTNRPTGFPLFLEGLGEHACWSGWYRDAGEVFICMDGGQFRAFREGQFFIVHRKPETVAWTGEGLPPVGTVCIFNSARVFDEAWHKLLPLNQDVEVTIIAHCMQTVVPVNTAVFTFEVSGGLQVEMGVAEMFSPIRTAEQIAAEERRKENLELADQISGFHGGETTEADLQLAEYLYDHDYRKQPPK